jgi:hypothetical protein
MSRESFNIFRVEYQWVEGEEGFTLVGKGVTRRRFEKDLSEAKRFAESLRGKEIISGENLGKGYYTECIPEYYRQILWFLKNKKGYVYCYFDEHFAYKVDNGLGRSILVERKEKRTKRSEIL